MDNQSGAHQSSSTRLILLAALCMLLFSCASLRATGTDSLPATAELTPTILASAEPQGSTPAPQVPTDSPEVSTETYTNETFGISIQYPASWFGPDIFEYQDGFRYEVGTDRVYPYGTGLEERQYEKNDAYYVTVQYTRGPLETTIEEYRAEQPWLQTPIQLLTMQNGQSLSDLRSIQTRVQEVKIGDYQGVEYIATLPDTAQTERVYVREVFLINVKYDTVRITGRPENVEISDPTDWKSDYQRVDEAHLESFRALVNSILLPDSSGRDY